MFCIAGNPDNQHGFEALWDQHMHCMAAVTTMLYRQGCVQVMAALQQGLISAFSALEQARNYFLARSSLFGFVIQRQPTVVFWFVLCRVVRTTTGVHC